ncbi:hypothetical protein AB0O91_16880 [Kitasatospora sp. NPDC089797]|uniref:hypothetical protein n=1 Tax=Kitasatospora sp. NPDC089797 TaxID=3155298 RepID=UPI00342CD393
MPARNRRLPRDLSWPLTPTDLREGLGAQEAEAADVYFGELPSDDGFVLLARWEPQPSSNYSHSGVRPAWWSPVRIVVAPVPAAERAATRRALRQDALPRLAAWITAARRAPEGWRMAPHDCSWGFRDGAVLHRGDGPPPG